MMVNTDYSEYFEIAIIYPDRKFSFIVTSGTSHMESIVKQHIDYGDSCVIWVNGRLKLRMGVSKEKMYDLLTYGDKIGIIKNIEKE